MVHTQQIVVETLLALCMHWGTVSNHVCIGDCQQSCVHTVALDCRTIYLEPLSLEEQIRVFASSQVVLMTHGSALVHTLFMAPVSHAIMI